LKLQYDETLSNFAFSINLRRYSMAFDNKTSKEGGDMLKAKEMFDASALLVGRATHCLLILYRCTCARSLHPPHTGARAKA